jgi:hypothetical protein
MWVLINTVMQESAMPILQSDLFVTAEKSKREDAGNFEN